MHVRAVAIAIVTILLPLLLQCDEGQQRTQWRGYQQLQRKPLR
jgi:hypothetical protein